MYQNCALHCIIPKSVWSWPCCTYRWCQKGGWLCDRMCHHIAKPGSKCLPTDKLSKCLPTDTFSKCLPTCTMARGIISNGYSMTTFDYWMLHLLGFVSIQTCCRLIFEKNIMYNVKNSIAKNIVRNYISFFSFLS